MSCCFWVPTWTMIYLCINRIPNFQVISKSQTRLWTQNQLFVRLTCDGLTRLDGRFLLLASWNYWLRQSCIVKSLGDEASNFFMYPIRKKWLVRTTTTTTRKITSIVTDIAPHSEKENSAWIYDTNIRFSPIFQSFPVIARTLRLVIVSDSSTFWMTTPVVNRFWHGISIWPISCSSFARHAIAYWYEQHHLLGWSIHGHSLHQCQASSSVKIDHSRATTTLFLVKVFLRSRSNTSGATTQLT
jgi:hypothetical protein